MGCKLALVKDLQLVILKMPPTIKVTISKNRGTANGRTTNELDKRTIGAVGIVCRELAQTGR
jgi:hypothetical protein